jgi:prepilin signal peptidase PulO-like enzyme (type II secretory pathway)
MKKVTKFVYWTPRILSIIFLCFLALFSLDIFDMQLGFWGTVLGLFMHNIPVFILLAVLLISWKHEIVGGIAFILAGIAYIVSLLFRGPFELYKIAWAIQISGVAFLIGILFLINWFRKSKKRKKKKKIS